MLDSAIGEMCVYLSILRYLKFKRSHTMKLRQNHGIEKLILNNKDFITCIYPLQIYEHPFLVLLLAFQP